MSKTKKKKFQMPGAMILLFLVLIFVVILTWFIPTSVVTFGENGERIIHFNAAFDGDGNVIENAGTSPAGLWDLLMAPIIGFANGSDVSFSILISGAFLAIINYAGALDAGIGALLKKYSGKTLLAILMLVFALMGTVYGSWEELPAYALVIIPLCVTAGYDVFTGFAVLFIGATIGNMASVVNPYSTGAAVAAIGNPNLSLGTGIAMRLLLFVVLYLLGAFLVIRYAERVKNDKTKSCLYGLEDINTLSTRSADAELPELTKKRKVSLMIFGIMILIIVVGYIPWHAIPVGDHSMYEVVNGPAIYLCENVPALADFLGADMFTYFGDWYFNEFSFVFLAGAIIIAFINKMSCKEFIRVFVGGAADLLGMCFVVSVSRGVSMIMGSSSSGMSVTFVYWIRNLLEGVPVWAFAAAAVLTYCLSSLFIQGTSSTAGITMPILGAVAMALFAASSIGTEGGQMILVSAFTVGLNFTASGLYPEATKMGVLELTNIPYTTYLKQAFKFMIPLLIAGTIVIMVSPYMGLV